MHTLMLCFLLAGSPMIRAPLIQTEEIGIQVIYDNQTGNERSFEDIEEEEEFTFPVYDNHTLKDTGYSVKNDVFRNWLTLFIVLATSVLYYVYRIKKNRKKENLI